MPASHPHLIVSDLTRLTNEATNWEIQMLRSGRTTAADRLARRLLRAWRSQHHAEAAKVEPAAERRADRIAAALDIVRRIEEVEPTLPATAQARTFLNVDRVVQRQDLTPVLDQMVPAPLQGPWEPDGVGVRRLSAPMAADVVVLAKFDLGEQAKLRAGYGQSRRSLAVQPVRPNGTCGITNSVRAHEIVSRYAPHLIPTMLGHGEIDDGLRYLVEEWVDGQPLVTSQRLAEHAPQLLEGLSLVHEGYGVTSHSVTKAWGSSFDAQWQAVRDAEIVPGHVGEAVADLIRADRWVRVSWTHGDLVASNVMSTPGGSKIIDWEYAGERPLMTDAAKVHLFAADKEPLLDLLLAEWGQRLAHNGYSAAEELALVHAKSLTRAPARMAGLAGHTRSGVFASQVARQAGLLADVLARTG